MALKSYKPTSPARRLTTSPDFAEITKIRPERGPLLRSFNEVAHLAPLERPE